jgi:hypothetical protein
MYGADKNKNITNTLIRIGKQLYRSHINDELLKYPKVLDTNTYDKNQKSIYI